jgi:excisionase family DNA binding protein
MAQKEVLTTGEVARICHVAPRTVSKWFDSGKLHGYRIPGSRDRRIPVDQLRSFMRQHGMPLKELDGNMVRVLILDPDWSSAQAVAASLIQTRRYEVETAGNDFDAGMKAGQFGPHVILVDVVARGVDAREILGNLRANPNLTATKVIAVAGQLTTAQREALLKQGFDGTLCRPYDVTDLVRTVEEATDLLS